MYAHETHIHHLQMTYIIKNRIFLIRILVISFLFFSSCYSQKDKVTKPNFILILTDDQSWVGTSFLADPNDSRSKSDYYQTPNIERLARRGIRMTNG